MSETVSAQPKRSKGDNLLLEPLVVEEDVVVLMIVFQDLEQGLLSFRACPRKRMGAQDRGRKPRWGREKTRYDVRGRHFGSSGLVSNEKTGDGRGAIICRFCSFGGGGKSTLGSEVFFR